MSEWGATNIEKEGIGNLVYSIKTSMVRFSTLESFTGGSPGNTPV